MSNDSQVWSAFISKHNKEFGKTEKYSSQHNLGEDVNFSHAYQKLRKIHKEKESDSLNPQDFLGAFRSQDSELQINDLLPGQTPQCCSDRAGCGGNKRQRHFVPNTDKTH